VACLECLCLLSLYLILSIKMKVPTSPDHTCWFTLKSNLACFPKWRAQLQVFLQNLLFELKRGLQFLHQFPSIIVIPTRYAYALSWFSYLGWFCWTMDHSSLTKLCSFCSVVYHSSVTSLSWCSFIYTTHDNWSCPHIGLLLVKPSPMPLKLVSGSFLGEGGY